MTPKQKKQKKRARALAKKRNLSHNRPGRRLALGAAIRSASPRTQLAKGLRMKSSTVTLTAEQSARLSGSVSGVLGEEGDPHV